MPKRAIALFDYRGSTDEELNFYEGDVFEVLNDEHPEWWFVQFINDTSIKGYVPNTYIKMMDGTAETTPSESRSHSDDEARDDEDSEEDSEESEQSDSEEIHDNDSRVDKVKRRDIVKTARISDPEPPRRSSARQSVNRDKLLKTMGISTSKTSKPKIFTPHGTTASYLAAQAQEGDKKLSFALFPQFTDDGLGFRDLFYDYNKARIKKRSTKCVVAFSVCEARHISLTKIPGYEVIGRRIRMGIFDKTHILSNIHTLEAILNSNQDKKWMFSTKTSLLFPKDDENTCFIRTNDVDINLCLLFELTVLAKKSEGKGFQTPIELTVGWGVLPLFTSDGGPIENRTYQIKLYPGSPFDKNVKNPTQTPNKGFFSLFTGQTTPSLEIRVWKLGKTALSDINQLPDTCISYLSAVPLLAFYRNVLAQTLLAPQMEGKTYNIIDPSLALLPKMADKNQLLQLATQIWEKKMKLAKRAEKKSYVKMKEKFTETLLVLWPLLYNYSATDDHVDCIKLATIEHLQESGALCFATKSPDTTYFAPLDTHELQFSVQVA